MQIAPGETVAAALGDGAELMVDDIEGAVEEEGAGDRDAETEAVVDTVALWLLEPMGVTVGEALVDVLLLLNRLTVWEGLVDMVLLPVGLALGEALVDMLLLPVGVAL